MQHATFLCKIVKRISWSIISIIDNVSIYNFVSVVVLFSNENAPTELHSYFYPKDFMICNEAVYNGMNLEAYNPVDFQTITYSVPLSSCNYDVLNIG